LGLLQGGRYFTGVAAGTKADAFMWSYGLAVNLRIIELGGLASSALRS